MLEFRWDEWYTKSGRCSTDDGKRWRRRRTKQEVERGRHGKLLPSSVVVVVVVRGVTTCGRERTNERLTIPKFTKRTTPSSIIGADRLDTRLGRREKDLSSGIAPAFVGFYVAYYGAILDTTRARANPSSTIRHFSCCYSSVV